MALSLIKSITAVIGMQISKDLIFILSTKAGVVCFSMLSTPHLSATYQW